MQNVKTAARRAGLGIAVAGIATVATVAPASAFAPTVTGTQPASSAGFDANAAAASNWTYSWSTDASGATTYSYGDGSTATSDAPASSVGAAAPAPETAPAPEAAPAPGPAPAEQSAPEGLSTQSVDSAASEAPADTNGITSTAMSYVGTPYVWGGNDTSGWDCSGFVKHVYAEHGIELPRLAADQGAAGTPTSDPQAGDLVVQNGGAHIGIYLGNGQMISALNPDQGTQVHSVDAMPVDYYASF